MKKLLIAMMSLGMLAGVAQAEERNKLHCTGRMEIERPMWQRVISLGLLHGTIVEQGAFEETAQEGTVLAATLAALNEESKAAMQSEIFEWLKVYPQLVRYRMTCVDAYGESFTASYDRSGVVEIAAQLGKKSKP